MWLTRIGGHRYTCLIPEDQKPPLVWFHDDFKGSLIWKGYPHTVVQGVLRVMKHALGEEKRTESPWPEVTVTVLYGPANILPAS